jgi:hypothetical protein
MPKQRMIPAGKSAYKMLPDFLRPIIDEAARSTKDRPWYFTFQVTEDFKEMIVAAVGYSRMPSAAERARDSFNFSMMVAALIERRGERLTQFTDCFHAVVYRRSARKDHERAARRYFKNAGGPDAVAAEMDAWVAANKAVTEEAPAAVLMHAAEYAGDGPQTVEETLDAWTKKAVEQFDAHGKVDYLDLGMAPDGSGQFFSKKGFQNLAEQAAFHRKADALLDERGLHRRVRVCEVWTAPVDSGVKPSKSDERKEAVVVAVSEGEQTIANVLYIERDWASGKAALLPPERADAV